MNELPVCQTCGVQHVSTRNGCAICADDRQWIPADGQAWTTLTQLAQDEHHIELRPLEPGLDSVEVVPAVAIGQRGLLIATPKGNLLWDIPGYLDDDAVVRVQDLGGIDAIAVSHPHFYGCMVDWANAFGASLWLPEADREWVPRTDTDIRWWADLVEPLPGLFLSQCGGHFDGSAILHWPAGADGRGAVFVGDSAAVCPDRKHFAFMRSYPNHIPLPPKDIHRITATLRRYPFERVYGAWTSREIMASGEAALETSVARYLDWIAGD